MTGRRERRIRKREEFVKRIEDMRKLPRFEDLVKEYPHLELNPEGPVYTMTYTGPFVHTSINLYADEGVEAPKVFRGLKINIVTDPEEIRELLEVEAEMEMIDNDEEFHAEHQAHVDSLGLMDWEGASAEELDAAERAADDLDEMLGDAVKSIEVFEDYNNLLLLVTLIPGEKSRVPDIFRGYRVYVCDPIPQWEILRYEHESRNTITIKEGFTGAEAIDWAKDFCVNFPGNTIYVRRAGEKPSELHKVSFKGDIDGNFFKPDL